MIISTTPCSQYTAAAPLSRLKAVRLKRQADPRRVGLPATVTTPVSPEVKALISHWEQQ